MVFSISCRWWRGGQVREGCLGEVKEIEERGKAGAHWWRRNQPEMLAEAANSGE
jgi:hypothetical protein